MHILKCTTRPLYSVGIRILKNDIVLFLFFFFLYRNGVQRLLFGHRKYVRTMQKLCTIWCLLKELSSNNKYVEILNSLVISFFFYFLTQYTFLSRPYNMKFLPHLNPFLFIFYTQSLKRSAKGGLHMGISLYVCTMMAIIFIVTKLSETYEFAIKHSGLQTQLVSISLIFE